MDTLARLISLILSMIYLYVAWMQTNVFVIMPSWWLGLDHNQQLMFLWNEVVIIIGAYLFGCLSIISFQKVQKIDNR